MVGLLGVLMVAACSAQPATQTATPAAATPTVTTPGTTPSTQPTQTATASVAPATGATQGGATGNECATLPSVNPSSSSLSDPALEAHFPAQIDGKPVEDVQSFKWLQIACLGGQQVIDRLPDTIQLDFSTLSMATARAEVDDGDVKLLAFRTAGADGNLLAQAWASLAAAAGENSQIGTFGPGTAGGKSVIVATDTDGNSTYAWITGDTLIAAVDVTQSQADKIFGAVQ